MAIRPSLSFLIFLDPLGAQSACGAGSDTSFGGLEMPESARVTQGKALMLFLRGTLQNKVVWPGRRGKQQSFVMAG